MIRAPRLVAYRAMYAFDPDSFTPPPDGYGVNLRAAWFKRRRPGRCTDAEPRIIATTGTYHPMVLRRDQRPTEQTYEAWIAAANDNRYGGTHLASWDGQRFLGSTSPAEAAEQLEFLRAMLAGYPNPPAGYDGWWTFQKGTS